MSAQSIIALRTPSVYLQTSTPTPETTTAASSSSPPPPLDFLLRTWHVTHSTLPMWRKARNVRITYTALPPSPSGAPRLDDLVEYQSNKHPHNPAVDNTKTKAVAGVDTSAADNGTDTSSWDWKGKGLLFFVHSHWEVLGWGETQTAAGGSERWVVTWFQKTIFSAEGLDIYCDGKGLSEETYGAIMTALKTLPKAAAELVERDMRAVEITPAT
jgi:hypothetical protein